jgi:hypothetical protein
MRKIYGILVVLMMSFGLLGMCPMNANADDPTCIIEGTLIYNDTQTGAAYKEITFYCLETDEYGYTQTDENGDYTLDVLGTFDFGTQTECHIEAIPETENLYIPKWVWIITPLTQQYWVGTLDLLYDRPMVEGTYYKVVADASVANRQNLNNNIHWLVSINDQYHTGDINNNAIAIGLGWGFTDNGVNVPQGDTYSVYLKYELYVCTTQGSCINTSTFDNNSNPLYTVQINQQVSCDPHIWVALTHSFNNTLLSFKVKISCTVIDQNNNTISSWNQDSVIYDIRFTWP